jgi:DNA-binding NtrC family response regulator
MKPAGRLLIVDDEPDTCANLADIFADIGYEVDIAHDGLSALELVKRTAYDVALLDLKMPGMNGLELYRRIKEHSAGTVAIVVTAYASTETASSVLEAGAWQILSKPVDFSRLSRLVSDALDQPLLLIVDDDEDLCESLWDLFREQDFRVCIAHNMVEADTRLNQRDYQAVIVDMKLPDGNGAEVVKLVQQRNPSARSLVVTGYPADMAEGVKQALAEGAQGVCYKPFDVPQLVSTIRTLVSS